MIAICCVACVSVGKIWSATFCVGPALVVHLRGIKRSRANAFLHFEKLPKSHKHR